LEERVEQRCREDYRAVLTEQREILPALPIGAIPKNYDLSHAIKAARSATVTGATG
jgi:hypothetical protein